MSGIIQKVMGPLMTAVGFGAAPFTGGATIPIGVAGTADMMSPGGVLGPSPSTPAPSIAAGPSTSAAPIIAGTQLPTSAGSGTSTFNPTAVATATPDTMANTVASNLFSTANPFAQFSVA